MKIVRKDEGFTLVELMVVVLIIGILVAIAIPVFNSAKAAAQQKSCFANERTVEGAWQTYNADSDSAGTTPTAPDYATALGQLVPKYVKTAPNCPAGGVYALAAGSTASAITITCGAAPAPSTFAGHGTHP